jgi:DNA repair exonuclease SbcCD nuclease subunit
MKIAILGDTHFGMRNDSVVFHDLYKKFYTETFIPYLTENNIDVVVQLGDLFDRRKYINFNSLKLAKDYFFGPLEEHGIALHTLLGNHDIFFKNTLEVNSTSLLLEAYNNITIYDKPVTVNFDGLLSFDIIPWICDDNLQECMDFINNSKSEFCFGHFEIEGYEMDRGNICHEGLDVKKLARYELVMSGHFHHRSSKGNILYVGTPGEMTWSDYDDPRGFHVFDTETREITFIENPHTIFRKVVYDDTNMFLDSIPDEMFEQYKNKYVKVVVSAKTNPFLFETYIDKLLKAQPIDVSVVEDFTETVSEDYQIDQADDTTTILEKYVDTMEIDLNKDKLKSIIKELYTEALSIE